MTPAMQVKFLRVLQERKFRRVGGTEETAANIRVIAATNRDLPTLVAEGKFREDLFYRLNVIPIQLPALRERPGDVPLIADHFLAKLSREMGKHARGLRPRSDGGARGLSVAGQRPRTRERGRAGRGARAGPAHRAGHASPTTSTPAARRRRCLARRVPSAAPVAALPEGGAFNLEQHLQDVEREHLERALRQASGVQTHAAELLGLSFRQFRYLAKKYNLRGAEGR